MLGGRSAAARSRHCHPRTDGKYTGDLACTAIKLEELLQDILFLLLLLFILVFILVPLAIAPPWCASARRGY